MLTYAVMYPRFVEETAGLLERFPQAGKAFTRVRRVSAVPAMSWSISS